MSERPRMFSATKETLRAKIGSLGEKLAENTEEMQALNADQDGDVMDTPLVFQAIDKRVLLEIEKKRLIQFLRDAEVISEENLGGAEQIAVGHTVKIKIQYPDGVEEESFVTIGTTFDKMYGDSKKRNGDLLSEDSPMVKVLLGRTKGETVTYSMPSGGEGKIQILDFVISPLAKTSGKK